MKKLNFIKIAILSIVLTTFNSCAVVGGIFKTGMGVGIILVVGVIGLIIFAITRAGKK